MRKKELKKRVVELEAEVAELQERLRYSMPLQRDLGSSVFPAAPFIMPNSSPTTTPLPATIIWPQNTWDGSDYYATCGCNPKNGGSGVCSCVNPGQGATFSVVI